MIEFTDIFNELLTILKRLERIFTITIYRWTQWLPILANVDSGNILLCGQTAAYYKIENNQLKDGVKIALSAMTAHTMLQSQSYSLNPF